MRKEIRPENLASIFCSRASFLLKSLVVANLLGTTVAGARSPQGEAPASFQDRSYWSSGVKNFFGSSYEAYDAQGTFFQAKDLSRVWFTGAQGILTEVFWPTIDRKQLRDHQFLVSDGASFLFEERKDSVSEVEWLETGVPAFRITNKDPKGRFEIQRTIYTDPAQDVLLMKIRIVRKISGLSFYVLHNPSVANHGLGDSLRVSLSDAQLGQGIYAWQEQDAQALVSTIPWKQASAGFVGSSDGYQDLAQNFNMDWSFASARNGDVAALAWLDLPKESGETEFYLALGFGASITQARHLALNSLGNPEEKLRAYKQEWRNYQASIWPHDSFLYRSSVALLKAMEDKTFAGAFVASPSVPWGVNKEDRYSSYTARVTDWWKNLPNKWSRKPKEEVGGYHLVWPRDLYQMATTFEAVGDYSSARASLQYLKEIQYGEDDGFWDYGAIKMPRKGSFLQNSWVDGEPYWNMLQIDQTSYPVLLAARLYQKKIVTRSEVENLVTSAADFIRDYGPWTFQDRWEENMGVGPASLAVQIAALRSAAELWQAWGDSTRAQSYRDKALEWDQSLERWTFTESGPLGNGKYFLRMVGTQFPTQVWNPNSNDAFLQVTNGGPRLLEKEVLDGGFFELLRFGIRRADDPFIVETLAEYDQELRVNTPQGPGFYRYSEDRYNWDEQSGRQTRGMIWPFLSGERAYYEWSLARLQGRSRGYSRSKAQPYFRALENFSLAKSGIIPEQVWSSGPAVGKPTGAATPLGWAHGEYVKLLRILSEQVD